MITFVRIVSAAVLVAGSFLSTQSAGAASFERPGIGRPALFGKPSGSFVVQLNAMVAAELASKDQKDTGTINPFSKPRPRPDREQLLIKRPSGAVPLPAK